MARHPARSLASLAFAALLIAASACAGISTRATISEQDLLKRLGTPNAPFLLDVRSPEEYGAGHIPSAVNIPYTQVAARLDQLTSVRNRDIVVYCESGPRSQYAESVLRDAGFPHVYHLIGDMGGWRQAGLPTQR
jgi:phage shock protein E